jgi:glycosyltransferase involved in cell wall biosynthesis
VVTVYRGLGIAVVVPAFNEARVISRTVEAVPLWIDRVVVVDDASHDATSWLATRGGRHGVEVVRHPANHGVGRSIVTGYRRVLALGLDAAVVMAGDGQMDPADLPALLEPLVDGRADYAKGNRFLHPDVWREMPFTRLAGNVLLSLATKVVSGYWRVFDSQCGYTAITRRALAMLDLDGVFPRYGYPNDLLARLHALGVRVIDVPVRPIYGPDWQSGLRWRAALHPFPWVLARAWWHRMAAPARPRTTTAAAPELPERAAGG